MTDKFKQRLDGIIAKLLYKKKHGGLGGRELIELVTYIKVSRMYHESKEEDMRIVLDEGAYMPLRGHSTDAGLDLRTPKDVTVPAGGSAVIDTGVHIELPKGRYGKLESKSGLNVKHSVVSLGGTIDESYIGSIVAKLYNLGTEDYTFKAGDKVVQMVIQPYEAPDLEVVDKLDDTDRGSAGFGSTGR